MSLFIAYIYEKGQSASSIQRTIDSLSYISKLIGQPNHSDSFLIRKIMCGINKQRLTPDTRLPICDSMLFQLIDVTYGAF